MANEAFLKLDIPDQYKVDASPFTDRPFFVGSFDWLNTNTQYSVVGPSTVKLLPGDIIRSNPSLLSAMKIASYYRSNLTLQISLAGTIAHAGTLLVGILPPMGVPIPAGNQLRLINTVLSGPHAFLAANEATSISIEVPWYCNSDLATLDMEPKTATYLPSMDIAVINGNYATLVFLVLNPLAVAATGASTSLTVTIDATFKNLDIYVPTPRYVTYQGLLDTLRGTASTAIDSGTNVVKTAIGDFIDNMRGAFRSYTGLHNPNDGTIAHRVIINDRNFLNVVDNDQYLEVLDPNANVLRTVDRPIFGTLMDEMEMAFIISKRQYIGTFKASTTSAVGTLVWARPISPFQGGIAADQIMIANNIELIHRLTRAWKGDIRITLQSVMNNKQQIKLRLLQMYNPSTKISSAYPVYSSILNAPSHLMEFTAGNQTQEVVLPFLCRNSICPNARDMSTEALFHGEYYIYVASKLANSDDSPTDIFFNVYLSMEPGSEFYGYSTESNYMYSPVKTSVQGYIVKTQSLDVMNEPQDQTTILSVNRSVEHEEYDRLMPIHDIRPFLRRMVPYQSSRIKVANDDIRYNIISIRDLFAQFAVTNNSQVYATPGQIFNQMYYGRTGGAKISMSYSCRFLNESYTPVDCNNYIEIGFTFLPPNYVADVVSGVIQTCYPNETQALDKWLGASDPTWIPLPLPYTVNKHGSKTVCECKVPNTSIFKFIGGPCQMLPTVGVTNNTSAVGVGDLFVSFTNLSHFDIEITYVVSMAYSDETRCGFHTMAPVLVAPTSDNKQITAYKGAYNDLTLMPSTIRNPYLYFST